MSTATQTSTHPRADCELNRQACYRYRATHLAQVCFINWIHYHRNRDRIVHQQQEWPALAKQNKQTLSPFQKLRALADVCSRRLIELDHGYARKEEEVGPPKNRASQRRYQEEKNAAMDGIKQVRARNCQRYYERIDRLKATAQYEAFKKKIGRKDCGAITPCRRSSEMK